MSSALFQQVVDATRGEYVLHGTLGASDVLGNAFLAHEAASGRSVLLLVSPGAESLDVVGALSDTIPADAGGCAACGFRIGTWVDACPRCEHPLLPPPGASPDAAVLGEQLRDSIDVVGSLPHVRGGTMYFGHDVSDKRLTAFVVRPQSDGQLALDVVWEAARETAAAAPVSVPTYDATHEPAHEPPYAPTYEPAREAATPHDAPTEYGTAYGTGAATTALAEPTRKRPLLPIGLGIGALALVGAAAFAFTRGGSSAHPAPAVPDTAGRVSTTPTLVDPPPSTAGTTTHGATSLPPILPNTDSAATAARQHRDSINLAHRLARTRAAAAAGGSQLTIEGELPSGSTIRLNGAPVPVSNRVLHLPPGQQAVILIEAPGYCPDTLLLPPNPQANKHWAPTLRGGSLRGGDC